MHEALGLLLLLRAGGWLRRLGRNFLSVKGALLTVVGLAIFAPKIMTWVMLRRMPTSGGTADGIRRYGPIGLLLYCALTVIFSTGERALYFTPAEVNFLFPGPFGRREVLAYKIAHGVGGSLFVAAFMAAMMVNPGQGVVVGSAYVGLVLGLMFIQLFAMAVALGIQTVGELAFNRTRKVILAVAGVALAFAIAPLVRPSGDMNIAALFGRFTDSPVTKALVWPLRPFIETYTAQSFWPGLLTWGSAALAIDVGLVGLVMLLDANYLEASAAASAKIYARIERARRGGGVSSPRKKGGAVRSRVPDFPWLGGAGPVAWRQFATATRSAARVVLMAVLLALFTAPVFFSMASRADPALVVRFAPVLLLISVLYTPIVAFDFRGDIDHMDVLKALPLAPSSVVAGELIAPALLLTAIQWVGFALVAVVVGPDLTLVALGAVALPFNWLLLEVDNLLFLLFPARLQAANPGDFQAIGRNIVLMLVKFLLLGLAAAAVAAFVFVAALVSGVGVTGIEFDIVLVAAFFVLTFLAVALMPLLGWAYKTFGAARDVPA